MAPAWNDDDDDWDDSAYDPDDDDLTDDEQTTTDCPHCGAEIYDDAERCPACGQYLSREGASRSRPAWITVAAFLALAGMLWWVIRMF